MQDNAMNPTHFNAFGNREEIDENNVIYSAHRLFAFDQICPHCSALYFKEDATPGAFFERVATLVKFTVNYPNSWPIRTHRFCVTSYCVNRHSRIISWTTLCSITMS